MNILRTLRLSVDNFDGIAGFYRKHQTGARYRRNSDRPADFQEKSHLLKERPSLAMCSCGVVLEIDRSIEEE